MVSEEISKTIHLYTQPFSSILLFGPPGAGKDFLGHFIANAGHQVYVSLGDIFRRYPLESPIRKLFHKYAVLGTLIPDRDVIAIWHYYIQGMIATGQYLPNKQDLLVSGVPRTLKQARLLDAYLHVRHVILLEVADETKLLERTQRSLHKKGRLDEVSVEVLQKRLQTYKKEIKEIVQYYPRHKISRINAEQKSLEVLRDILSRLAHVLSHPCNLGD
ncbi:adenylate kinase family protein [Candidatus Chlamydia sanziniae]|uniref:Adenylate kinase n=1 Tax=Candidatus Chlamydia sanziniae TaxID=1806891 RepID=A0A1A9HXH5_9CHLA|nr:nucleoside monophosphate kinase [Candidatus Chlamydia sanziniae]ANH78803.1 Adenylate kinase [Candidatus Chlamydia sanziniae]